MDIDWDAEICEHLRVGLHLLQDELFFRGGRICNGEMSQETLQIHQVWQLIDQDGRHETSELWCTKDKHNAARMWGSSV